MIALPKKPFSDLSKIQREVLIGHSLRGRQSSLLNKDPDKRTYHSMVKKGYIWFPNGYDEYRISEWKRTDLGMSFVDHHCDITMRNILKDTDDPDDDVPIIHTPIELLNEAALCLKPKIYIFHWTPRLYDDGHIFRLIHPRLMWDIEVGHVFKKTIWDRQYHEGIYGYPVLKHYDVAEHRGNYGYEFQMESFIKALRGVEQIPEGTEISS